MSVPRNILVHLHARALADVQMYGKRLAEYAARAIDDGDSAHTSGNITSCAGSLDAAREKACALREALEIFDCEKGALTRG